ncbi:MAG: lasso peptide biosynthesis B2 protein [Cyclobacteriaceae bacterium]
MQYQTGHTKKTNTTAVKPVPIFYINKTMSLLGRLLSKPLNEQLLLPEILFYLALSRILILFIPIKYYHLLLEGKNMPPRQNNNSVLHFQLIKHIQRNIKIISNYVPWRAKCFEQSMAMKLMMKRRKISITLLLGVLKNENALKAHAWIQETTTPYDKKFAIVKSFK